MAKRQRDYAAEYRRRVEKAKQAAQAKGEQFDLAKARGHGSRQQERQRQRAGASGRFTRRTLGELHSKMLNTDHAMERLLGAQNDGLTIAQIEALIELQNESYRLWYQGHDTEARAMSYQAGALADDYGATDEGWTYYH